MAVPKKKRTRVFIRSKSYGLKQTAYLTKTTSFLNVSKIAEKLNSSWPVTSKN